MGNLFQTLEKLNVQKNGPKLQSDDLQALRHTTSMVQRYVATQGMYTVGCDVTTVFFSGRFLYCILITFCILQ